MLDGVAMEAEQEDSIAGASSPTPMPATTTFTVRKCPAVRIWGHLLRHFALPAKNAHGWILQTEEQR